MERFKKKLPSIIFNTVEFLLLFGISTLIGIAWYEGLCVLLLFTLVRNLVGKGKHYKNPLLCLLWSSLVFYDTLLNFKDMQAQLAACCCDLKTAVHSEGEETRQLIQANTIQDLRDRLAASQRETDTANLALQNNAQTSTILNSLGRFVTNPGVPLNTGCGCACNYNY